ncbi:S-layer homology domain-containing protein [Lutispora thermophila]|uniref:S-layer homology domain-containing protein n=1 Tax=Lutispora thermophila DSM 19022 TaxID=1122184 RepID=A0A1M6BVS2_9FIRM|nr:S-layer homology domain-containing protein [Lutispora thermophila]SHI52860.1 S-layer homology domain-containing protein [Lutispora thermophila DSM 19022]
MKQKLHISIILILSLLFTTIFAQGPTYTVPAYGRTTVEQGVFSDISSSPYAADILRLRLLNIIQGGAGTKYRPNDNITYQEAAAYLIRLLGFEEEALQKAADLAEKGTKPVYDADSWALGYIEQAIELGILTTADIREMETLTKAQQDAIEKEVTEAYKKQWMPLDKRNKLREEKTQAILKQNRNMKKAISRQDLAQWIARALKLEEIPSNNVSYVYKYKDYNSIKADRLMAVETLLQKEILPSASKDKYSPTLGVARGQAAKVMTNIIDKYPDKIGIETGVARLMETKRNYVDGPGATNTELTLIMENFDGTGFEIKIQGNQALPVIKNNRIYDHQILRQGDALEYTKKDDQVIFGSLDEYQFLQGTLSYVDKEGNLRIEDSQKKITELKVGNNTVITALGKPAKDTSLIPGQSVKALYKGSLITRLDIQESVDYYADTEYIDGIIKYIDKAGRILKLEDYDGNLRTYGLDDRVIVTVNEYYEDLDSLHNEQDATFEISGRTIKAIKAFTAPGEEASKEYQAILRVRDVGDNTIKVSQINDRQNPMTFKTDSFTSITYLGYPIKLYNIKTGDMVKIKIDGTSPDRADEIQLMTKRQRVEKIYKARILNTLPTQNRVALSDVQSYKYPDWSKLDDERTFPVKRDAEIYKDGRKLTLEDLDKQRNVEAYIVTVKDFGEETIAKMTLKSVSEDSVFSGSFDTQWTDNAIKLADGQKLKFDEGTIIIKDRRLLDTTDLTYNDEAFIVKNRLPGGTNYAALVSMENGNGFDYRNVVRGYIHDMGEDNFSLESYADLINNEWDYHYGGEKYFYVSKDSKILDNVVKNNYITRDTFLESRFWKRDSNGKPLKSTDKNKYTIHDPLLYVDEGGPHYEKCKSQHMLAYAVINEDGEATAINIYKRDGNLGKENVTFTENLITGEVVKYNETYTQLTLTDVKEYSKFYNQWQPTKSNTVINTKKAVIIKNEQVVTLSQLDVGDKIYAITDQNNGIIIFVE